MQDKVYVLLAGVNGAGKSTFYSVHGGSGPLFPFCDNDTFRKMPQVNSDKIVKTFGDWRNSKDQYAAGKIAVKTIRDYFNRGVSFSQETTLAGRLALRNIETAKANGYKVGVIYVGVDSVDIAKERVLKRVSRGGHGIPEEDIERRYLESFKNLNSIMDKCDFVLLYDNSNEQGFRTVAEYDGEKLKLIGGYSPLPHWIKEHIDTPVVCELNDSRRQKFSSMDGRDFDGFLN